MARSESQSEASWAEPALTCACFNLRKAARAVTQLYDAALAGSGLKGTQFTVLVAVAMMDGAPLSPLAHELAMDRTTLTRNLRPLIAGGLIEDGRGEDGRERLIRLTKRGRATLERALPLWRHAQGQLLRRLGTARWQSMQHDLAAVRAAADTISAAASR